MIIPSCSVFLAPVALGLLDPAVSFTLLGEILLDLAFLRGLGLTENLSGLTRCRRHAAPSLQENSDESDDADANEHHRHSYQGLRLAGQSHTLSFQLEVSQ